MCPTILKLFWIVFSLLSTETFRPDLAFLFHSIILVKSFSGSLLVGEPAKKAKMTVKGGAVVDPDSGKPLITNLLYMLSNDIRSIMFVNNECRTGLLWRSTNLCRLP